jgi:hypothetical protein
MLPNIVMMETSVPWICVILTLLLQVLVTMLLTVKLFLKRPSVPDTVFVNL